MDIFQVPISAVITIVACCSAVAVTLWNPSFDTEPKISQSISQKAYYSTYAERLLNRHLKGEEFAYERLLQEAQAAYGERAGEELLKTVEKAIKSETNHELRGKLFTLRGLLFMDAGSREKAVESLRTALNFDPYSKVAVDTLNTARGIGGGRPAEDQAATEKPEGSHAEFVTKQP
jgi:tetratricopeptide (TPR) repeat protein